jgi:DNA-binding GntR family transcriptional regulator
MQLTGRIGRSVEEHARIIDAVVSRHEEAADHAVRTHIRNGWDELQAALKADPSLGRAMIE